MAHESDLVAETGPFPNLTDIPAARALSLIQDRLDAVGIADSRYEATLLLRAALEVSRERLLIDRDLVVSAVAAERVQSMVQSRMRLEPLQYILGSTEFYGREFSIDQRVLIPRPETELLVEQAVAFARERRLGAPRVLDIGTGSGILAITLAAELPGAEVVATDISVDALQVAQGNAGLLRVSERIEFVLCSLADDVDGQFDVVVTNPPYVLTGFLDGDKVQPELAHEPRLALDGGLDGMDVYRPLIVALAGLLRESGLAVIE
ncbi:MAG: peptide chain release factor N(5)-glutamine methyltransferase, partial [Chloroflexi bacterium]|nr:peptide chain release factor N(5)-glutamine methyltransferase [Chloroflexota bacterium]